MAVFGDSERDAALAAEAVMQPQHPTVFAENVNTKSRKTGAGDLCHCHDRRTVRYGLLGETSHVVTGCSEHLKELWARMSPLCSAGTGFWQELGGR